MSDFKFDDFEHAKVKTFGYCIAIVNKIGGMPFIAMPCTRGRFVMYLCFAKNDIFKKSSLVPIVC